MKVFFAPTAVAEMPKLANRKSQIDY